MRFVFVAHGPERENKTVRWHPLKISCSIYYYVMMINSGDYIGEQWT